MSFITAERIHNGRQWLPKGTAIELADDGTIVALHEGGIDQIPDFYEGILCPGFVNVHCHLELSHMKDVIPERTGLIPFLQTIPPHRNDHSEAYKKEARHRAFKEMLQNGIVAVGDIVNEADTLDLREQDKMHFSTFVETIGFSEANVQRSFERSLYLYKQFEAQEGTTKILKQSIVPHAPYSVSKGLFRLIDKHKAGSIISIHNQESRAEDEYYFFKKGPINKLLHGFGIDDSFFKASGKSSVQTYMEWLSDKHSFIFVHNTYTGKSDLQIVNNYFKEVHWCFCPNANLYIENTLPDVEMFVKEGAMICVGTDSLASNYRLSVLSELQTLKKHFSSLSWETLLQWGTYNGACALQMEDNLGSIAPGKQPGILQIIGLEEDAVIKLVH